MAGRALSEQVKRQRSRRAENARYQEAIEAYFREQSLPEGKRKRGLRPIAKQYDVKWRTLGRLVNGGVSMSAFNAVKDLPKKPKWVLKASLVEKEAEEESEEEESDDD